MPLFVRGHRWPPTIYIRVYVNVNIHIWRDSFVLIQYYSGILHQIHRYLGDSLYVLSGVSHHGIRHCIQSLAATNWTALPSTWKRGQVNIKTGTLWQTENDFCGMWGVFVAFTPCMLWNKYVIEIVVVCLYQVHNVSLCDIFTNIFRGYFTGTGHKITQLLVTKPWRITEN